MLMLKHVALVRVEISGKEHYDEHRPCIIVANHQSEWETMIGHVLFKNPIYIMKEELCRLWFFGACAKHVGMICLKRDGSNALKVIRKAKAALERSHTVIIFPEGTRQKAGKLGEFNPGVHALYKISKVKVIPVALDSGNCWPKGSLLKPGTVHLKFLKPIEPGIKDSDVFMNLLEKRTREGVESL